MKNTTWVAPLLLVLGIFIIWLILTYLPLDSLGITIPKNNLWLYMPWLVMFAIGLYALKVLRKT